jgi:septum formation topological specificity factor MinE
MKITVSVCLEIWSVVISTVPRTVNDLKKEILQVVEKIVKCYVPDKYGIAVSKQPK